jgi:hypothetical protein
MTTATGDRADQLARLSNASLSDKQWRTIQDSLRFAVAVDANLPIKHTLREVPGYRLGKQFGKECSLREALPVIAIRCCMLAGLPQTTPKQVAAELTRIIKSCNALLTCLDSINFPDCPVLDNHSRRRLRELTSPIEGELETYVAALRGWRDELSAVSTKGNHASSAHNLFWQELACIFDAHVGNDVKFRNRRKIRFLRACTEPFFPEAITSDDGAISASNGKAPSPANKHSARHVICWRYSATRSPNHLKKFLVMVGERRPRGGKRRAMRLPGFAINRARW